MISGALARLPPSIQSLHWQKILPGVLVLAASAALFAYAGYGAPERATAAQALALEQRIRSEDAALRVQLRELGGAAAPGSAAEPGEGTSQLKQIDSVASQAGIRLVRLAPQVGNRSLFDVTTEASFPAFLGFVAEIEARRGVLHHLLLRRSDTPGADQGSVAGSFALELSAASATAPHAAVPRRSAELETKTAEPFAQLPTAPAPSLSHRLTGITRIGTEVSATIDGLDYAVGDSIGNAVVTAIQADGVELASGPVRYWLRFDARAR